MPALTSSATSLAAQPAVRTCLDWFRRERAWINEQHLKLCRIPAATFFEQRRGEWMAEQFRALGWESKIDRGGNTIGYLKGSAEGPQVARIEKLAGKTGLRVVAASGGKFLFTNK